MSKLSEAIWAAKNQTRTLCIVGKHLDLMDAETREAVEYALSVISSERPHPVISATWLAKTMKDDGFPVSRYSVLTHVRQECACATSK